MASYRQGPRNYGPSKNPVPCKRGENCSWDQCQFLHPWNSNWPGPNGRPVAVAAATAAAAGEQGWGTGRPTESDLHLYYGEAPTARPDLVRRRTSEEGWSDERESVKRARTDSWGYGAGSGHPPTPSTAAAPSRFGVSSLDRDLISPVTSFAGALLPPSAHAQTRADPRARPPQRAASSAQSTASASPAITTSAFGFLSPQTSTVGGAGQPIPDLFSGPSGSMADARASQIIVPELGNNVTLDQIRNPNDVLQFVMRRMSAAVRTNVTREDLVAKHLVLKSLRQTVAPLPLPGSATPNNKVEEQLDASRRAIHAVEQKLARYQTEVEVGWRHLGLTIALGHLPGLAEVRDVEGVRMWIDSLKSEMGRYLEDRMRDEVRRAEGRVVQAAQAPRPRDEDVDRRMNELAKTLDDLRLEQIKQRRLDSSGLLARLDALEREMGERRKVDADAQAEIETLHQRMFELQEVFSYTRTDLDTVVERVDQMEPRVAGVEEVENELRALIDSAIASVPDKPTLVNSILDRLTPQIVGVLQKNNAHVAEELKSLQARMDERLALLGLPPGSRLLSDLDNPAPSHDRSQSEGAMQLG